MTRYSWIFLIFPDLSLILGKIINKKRVTKFPESSAIVLYVIYFISSFQFLLKYFKRYFAKLVSFRGVTLADIHPNIQPNIEANIGSNIESNIQPNIEPYIEPNIKPKH